MIEAVNKLPGPKSYPIFGTVLDISGKKTDLFELILKQNHKYGPIYRTWMGSMPVINVMKAEHIEIILRSSTNISKGHMYNFFKAWLGEGLLVGSGHRWHARRKLLTPTFHFKILEDIMDVFVEKSEKLVEILSRKPEDEYFDILPLFKLCGLDVICKAAMGVDLNAMEDSENEYVKAVNEMTHAVLLRYVKPWYHYDFIFKRTNFGKRFNKTLSTLHQFTDKVIKEKKQLLIKTNSKPDVTKSLDDFGIKRRLMFLDLLLDVAKGKDFSY